MLEVRGVHKTYFQKSSKLHVLKGVDVAIAQGEVVAIVGPSGAGKSTLLHIMGALDEPDEGQVLLDGQDIYQLKERERSVIRNQRIGFVFQFYHLLPEFSALENVLLPALVHERGGDMESLKFQAASLLDRMGLQARRNHKPSELSGGEQQRVAIARALVKKPALILADEPTGNLDTTTGRQILEILTTRCRESGMSLLMVSHSPTATGFADRVLSMIDGVIAAADAGGAPMHAPAPRW